MRGRFGLAVENIGDIDSDGYSDVAVSAPYIGQGVVYIFRGAGDYLVTSDYQVGGHVTTFNTCIIYTVCYMCDNKSCMVFKYYVHIIVFFNFCAVIAGDTSHPQQ